MLHIVCVEAGNYLGRGAEYVAKLYKGVSDNATPPFDFTVITDRVQEGLYPPGVKMVSTPTGVTGWYNKLYLFKRGLFPTGGRVLFLDLDTIILNNIDDLLAYEGDFAILRDFFHPERYGPGVMAWRAGMCPEIWDEWEKQGRPLRDLGDLTWINSIWKRDGFVPDVLQDFIPGIYSYKAHCRKGLPANTCIVCFHGKPRPHEVDDAWMEAWQ